VRFVEDDGGRADAGYRGRAGDCVVRAVAIATGLPYQEVYDDLAAIHYTRTGTRSAREGTYPDDTRAYLASLGWEWTPTMGIGTGCTVHLREDELPAGRIIARLSRHTTAVIDGTIHDTYDPSRDGTRCVYGYWKEP
jgi:imidazolonepropionase-like amidohydrolase